MKVKDIFKHKIVESWLTPPRSELDYEENEEDMHLAMQTEFNDNKTSIKEFDPVKIKRILKGVLGKNPELRSQADKMLATWNDDFTEDKFMNNEDFNKIFKQYEQLVSDEKDTPLIQFNRLHSLTKDIGKHISKFDDYKDSDDAFSFKKMYYSDK